MSLVETRRSTHFTVELRTPQASHLRYIADRDSVSLSRALANIIASHADLTLYPFRPVRKVAQHISISPENLAILDRIAAGLGLSRSDVARRLIDQARLGAAESV